MNTFCRTANKQKYVNQLKFEQSTHFSLIKDCSLFHKVCGLWLDPDKA